MNVNIQVETISTNKAPSVHSFFVIHDDNGGKGVFTLPKVSVYEDMKLTM